MLPTSLTYTCHLFTLPRVAGARTCHALIGCPYKEARVPSLKHISDSHSQQALLRNQSHFAHLDSFCYCFCFCFCFLDANKEDRYGTTTTTSPYGGHSTRTRGSMMNRIRRMLPGGTHRTSHTTSATQAYQKRGMMNKIKHMLPGGTHRTTHTTTQVYQKRGMMNRVKGMLPCGTHRRTTLTR